VNRDLVVVGGGPAGLTAALAAARRGLDVTLVEASDRLGGMAASIDVGGQRVDLGSHRLHPDAPPRVAALLDELLGNDLQVRERNGRVRLAGSWVRFPFRPLDLARSAPPSFAARLAADLVRTRSPDGDAATYADVVRSGLGPTALERFHGPMAAKLWGRPAEELAAELAQRRIGVRDRVAVARRLARTSTTTGRRFSYPRLGYGQIVERLADTAVAAGVEIRLGEPAALRPAGHVVWTAPVADLAAELGGPGDLLRHRGVVLVYLVVPRPTWTPYDAHYVPDPEVAFARLSEPKNYRDGPDPDDRTVLCAELPASVGDDTWSADDHSLAELVTDGIGRLGLPVPDVAGVRTVRLPRVYPVLDAADPAARDRLLRWADRLDGITVLGRQGLAVADNLHHVLDMALTFADCLTTDGHPDPARWAQERRRFDTFVVDD
jgi:protoporphyrinogen oxidase